MIQILIMEDILYLIQKRRSYWIIEKGYTICKPIALMDIVCETISQRINQPDSEGLRAGPCHATAAVLEDKIRTFFLARNASV